MKIHALRAAAIATLALAAASAHASNIAYVSSASGYMLHNAGGTAVTADWNGQAPLQSFSGYGRIHLGGQCLTGRDGGQPLRWEGCRDGDKSQVWGLSGSKLNNELGWCADVEGNRSGAGVRVLAFKCSGASNQQWRGHKTFSIQDYASRIASPQLRADFERAARSAKFGAVINPANGQVVSAGGMNLISAGGGNVIAVGGGQLISAGGLN